VFYLCNLLFIILNFFITFFKNAKTKDTYVKLRKANRELRKFQTIRKEFQKVEKNGNIKVLDTLDDSIYSMTFVSMMEKIEQRYDLSFYVEDYFFKSCLIFAIQILIIGVIIKSIANGTDGRFYVKPTLGSMVLRLTTSYLYHLGNNQDVADAYRKLKFLKNNGDKFVPDYIVPAFLCTQF